MSLQVELLEQSFESIKPKADEFVNSFYENLFTATPEAKPLFATTDMEAQKKKLLSSLVLVVENLRQPEILDSALRGLGARHVKYGALPEHYPLVGSALLATFEQYLQEAWTPPVKQAWVEAYGAISEIMLDGADYSETEIALPTPTGEMETVAEAGDTASPSSGVANTATATITAKPETSNTEIAVPQAAPLTSTSDRVDAANSDNLACDSNKASKFALLGGGIMGILAIILVLLI